MDQSNFRVVKKTEEIFFFWPFNQSHLSILMIQPITVEYFDELSNSNQACIAKANSVPNGNFFSLGHVVG